jgi:hypothetical protein
MPTTVTRTIGSGGDYTTLQAWEDASPANLVTNDEIWLGSILSGTNFTNVTLAIAGSTSDATRYKHLTVATGASFCDNANVRTNALRFNTANGCYIDSVVGYTTIVDIDEIGARVSRLQIRSGATNELSVRLNKASTRLTECIIAGSPGSPATSGSVVRQWGDSSTSFVSNCLIQRNNNTTTPAVSVIRAGLVNCTIVNVSGTTSGTGVLTLYTGTSSTHRNLAVFGFSTATDNIAGTSSQTNYTDATSPGSGWTGGAAFSTATFESVTTGSFDLRLKSGSALIDAGTTDTTYGTPDISLTARSGTYDVGCWEFASGGGGATSLSARRAFPRPILNF